MDPMKKPEWFELVENDGGLPRQNARRGFRALALSIPLMAIGIGVVLAQTSNEAPASAETTSVAATQVPIVTTSSVAPKVVATPKKFNQPSIAKPPVGSEEDDEFEGDDD